MSSSIRFGPFSLDPAGNALLQQGRRVELQRKPFEVLVLLAERAGELVTREQLYTRLWPDGTHVDFEHGLNTAVRKLRRALGETSGTFRFLETVAGRGYRFHLGVEAPRTTGGCVLAMRVEEAGEATLEEIAAFIALWCGEEVEHEPPALVVRFASEDDAARCAVGMVQRARSTATRLHMGLGVGPESRSEALRLCAAAGVEQILAAASLVGALGTHDGLRLRDHAPVAGPDAAPIAVVTLEASALPPAELLGRPPFVGRSEELARLTAQLEGLASGRGGLVLIRGEPGIGKTRLIEEFATSVRRVGGIALVGRCMEDGLSSHSPLADALDPYLYERDHAELRRILPREAASVVARIVPALRDRPGDLPESPALRADEDRLRLLDAVAQVFAAIVKHAPVLLALDDLHWADALTRDLIAHLARAAAQMPLLILGSHRDTPPTGAKDPLAGTLGGSALETTESLALSGLDSWQVRGWIERLAPGRTTESTAASIHRASGGNPLFVRELLLVWASQLRGAPQGAGANLRFDTNALPSGILELITQRLATLSEHARRLLTAASAAGAVFRFDVAARAAGLEDELALDALDESYDARLVRSAGGVDDSEFFHALIRQALYDSVAPARRVRLHRRLAEELARASGARPAEIAEQYHRSRELPGAEPGADFALEAASHAECSAGFDAAAKLLRMALDLLPTGDPRRTRALHRLGLALAWGGAGEEAARVAHLAGERIAAEEGPRAAAAALADMADALYLRFYQPLAGAMAEQGLYHAGDRRDLTWLRLAAHRVLALEVGNPELSMLPTDTQLRRDVCREMLARPGNVPPRIEGDLFIFDSREQAIEIGSHMPGVRLCWIGDYRGALPMYREQTRQAVARGQLALAADRLSASGHAEIALGNLDAAEEDAAHVEALLQRSEPHSFMTVILPVMAMLRARVRGKGIEEALARVRHTSRAAGLPRSFPAGHMYAMGGAFAALLGRSADALRLLDLALPAVEKGPAWAVHQTPAISNAVEILWRSESRHHLETIERCLQEKTLKPDFRFPDTDARLSMARLCALSDRFREASEWFARARFVLDEQGARPLRAITDYDEAWMYLRRAAPGDKARALPLLEAAIEQFESVGMPGWVARAERLERA